MEKPTTKELKALIDELLKTVHQLAVDYPVKTNDFLKILVGIYRKNVFTLYSIRRLSDEAMLADSTLDLCRGMIEDAISVEYIIAKDKVEMARKPPKR